MAHRLMLALALLVLVAPAGEAGRAARRAARCEVRAERAAKALFGRLLRCRRLAKGVPCETAARERLQRRMQRLAGRCHRTCMAEQVRAAAEATLAELEGTDDAACRGREQLLVSPLEGGQPAECGGPGFDRPATPPFSGEVRDAAGDPLADLMVGCVYTGDGVRGASAIYPYNVDGPTTIEVEPQGDSDVVRLVASGAPGPLGCSKGWGPTSHCLGNGFVCDANGCGAGRPCVLDLQCGGPMGSCQPDPNCFATAPVELDVSGSPVCLVNVVRADVSGVLDVGTGEMDMRLPITTRIYVEACPRCEGDQCTGGERSSEACTPSDVGPTSVDCLPMAQSFIGALDLDQATTTDVRTLAATPAGFCLGQANLGAFGLAGAASITQTGVPAGDLRDLEPHEATTVIVDCIPATGNAVIDGPGGLPFPLAVARRGAPAAPALAFH